MTESWAGRLYNRAPPLVQGFLLSRVGAHLKRRRFGHEYQRWMDLCAQSEGWSATEQHDFSGEQVRRVVDRAWNHVPYYRRVMNERGLTPADFRSVDDLPKLPVLTKEIIRTHGAELLADDVDRRRLTLGHTSGTTGSPLEFWWDIGVDIATNAMVWRHRLFANFEFGRPYATLLGRTIVPLAVKKAPFWRYNSPWNQLFLSSFHLREENLAHYFDAMKRHGCEALEAYPSNAYLLARYLESQQRYFPLQAVFTSSETLLDVQRALIAERFECSVYDYYGQAERVMFSGECHAHAGHHHFVAYGAMEVLNGEGEPLDGGVGRLVLTGFANDAMPLIRYEIGDVAGRTKRPCPCGRTLPLLSTIATKAEDIIVTPDGRYLSPSVLTHPFKPMSNVKASQIIQESRDHLRILIVRRPEYSGRDTENLLGAFRERVGEEMRIDVEFVDEIPLGPRGKFRWVVSRVGLRFGDRTVENLYGD